MAFSTIDEAIGAISEECFNDPKKDERVEEAKCMVSQCVFGAKYNLAVALYSCHLLALDNRGDGTSTNPNPVGVITEEREDRVQIKFAPNTAQEGTDSWYRLTNFGSRFLALKKSRIFTARTRCMGC